MSATKKEYLHQLHTKTASTIFEKTKIKEITQAHFLSPNIIRFKRNAVEGKRFFVYMLQINCRHRNTPRTEPFEWFYCSEFCTALLSFPHCPGLKWTSRIFLTDYGDGNLLRIEPKVLQKRVERLRERVSHPKKTSVTTNSVSLHDV